MGVRAVLETPTLNALRDREGTTVANPGDDLDRMHVRWRLGLAPIGRRAAILQRLSSTTRLSLEEPTPHVT